MRTLLACSALLLLPLSALAADAPCKFTEARQLSLQPGDADTVVFEVNQHDLRLTAGNGTGTLAGRACASTAEALPQLTLSQRRDGNKLVVSLRREGQNHFNLGQNYAWLDISGSVPANLRVQLKVGSGDAQITGARSLSVDVGSGDAIATGTRGSVHASVGSGDLNIDGAATVDLLALGSGDVQIHNVERDARIGSIGSGDLELRDIGGNLRLDRLGSGDVKARTVRGNAEFGTSGSGDIDVRAVGGNVTVASHGSGDVDVDDVAGNLTVHRSGSGSVTHRNVRGTVSLPRGK